MATDNDETLIRGDDEDWTIQLLGKDRAPLPLRSIEVRIVAKPPGTDQQEDDDALYIHSATFDASGGIIDPVGIRLVGDPDDGVIEEFLTPTDIETLATVYDGLRQTGPWTLGRYDVQVLDATGKRKTVISGDVAMKRDVGRG